MAKGNMMQGTARGKVGDTVFARVKGQQTARLYNPQVTNPRSSGQVYQRTIFADAVKFFTRGNKALFKFAFEDKKQSESDYNAFMRVNAKRGVNISKKAYDNYDYPALGNWIMTKGSLYPMETRLDGGGVTSDTNLLVNFKINYTGEVPQTVGQLARVLIASGHYVAGDILTFVMIRSYYEDNLPQVEPEATGSSEWLIHQIILNPDDVRLLNDVETGYECFVANSTLYIATTGSILGADYNSAAAIHSRNTTSGLKVSTQEIVNDQRTIYAIEAAREESYIAQVIASWQMQAQEVRPDAILQGAVAQTSVNIADVFTTAEAQAGGSIENEKAPFIETGVNLNADQSTDAIAIHFVNGTPVGEDDFSLVSVAGGVSIDILSVEGTTVNVALDAPAVDADTPFVANLMYHGQLLATITGTIVPEEP